MVFFDSCRLDLAMADYLDFIVFGTKISFWHVFWVLDCHFFTTFAASYGTRTETENRGRHR